jgi:hypothetical protein
MRIVRADKSVYVEGDESAIHQMVKAGVVEGIASRSGIVRLLRLVCSEEQALERLAKVRRAESSRETPGYLLGDASRNIFLEALETGRCWTFKQLRALDFAGAK